MFNATSFSYGGVSSEELGLYIAKVNGKSVTESSSLGADLDIREEHIPGRIRSLFYGVHENSALEFDLEFAAEDVFDRCDLEQMASVLAGKGQYEWLEIDQPDLRDVRFRCILNNFKVTTVTGEPIGMTCTVHCDSPYAWEFPKKFSVTVGSEGTAALNIYNSSSSNRIYEPQMTISLPAGAQSFEISNANDNGRVFKLSSENAFGSPVTFNVDNDRRIINSADAHVVQNCYTYIKENGYKFFRLVKGMNKLNVTAPEGTVLTIKCEFPKRIGG